MQDKTVEGKGLAPKPARSGRKRWLVLSYFSNLDGMACAQHMDDRLRWLARAGKDPIHLTGVCGNRWDCYTHYRVASPAPSGLRFEARHFLRKHAGRGIKKAAGGALALLLLPFYLLEKMAINLDSQWSWWLTGGWQGLKLARKFSPEVIYSTGGAPSAHAAAAWIVERTGLPWIAELQDPIVFTPWTRGRRALRYYTRLENQIARGARAVVFLTREARDRFAGRTGAEDKSHFVYAGGEPSTIPQVAYARGERCAFAHFGSLSGTRNLDTFLEALEHLTKAQPELRDVIRVQLHGHMDSGCRAAVNRFAHPEMIDDRGRVPREESLRRMAGASVLLLIQHRADFSAETIPSKFYEYLLTGRPVMGLVDRNPELAGLLETRGGIVCDVTSPREIEAGILRALDHWRQGGAPRMDSQPPLTVENAVEKLIALAR